MELSGKIQQDPGPGTGDAAANADAAVEAAQIARARQGDEAAWTALMQRHQEPIFRLAYLMLGSSGDTAALAEDVAQETFVRAYLNLDQFEDGRPLRPWLLAIAANLARNRKRSIGRYWGALRRWWQAQRVEKAAATPTQDERDDARLLWQAIQQLEPAQQQVLYMRYFLDMAEADMAEALSVAPGTVKSRLYRARQALESVLEEAYPAAYEEWQRT